MRRRKPKKRAYGGFAQPAQVEDGVIANPEADPVINPWSMQPQPMAGSMQPELGGVMNASAPVNPIPSPVNPFMAQAMLAQGDALKQKKSSGGLVNHASGGRADAIDMSVNDGSYVIPADVVSAMGEGNSMAGAQVLDQLFGKQPGSQAQDGGDVDLSISGGEYVVEPEILQQIGQGDLAHGQDILDNLIKQVRSKNIKQLQTMPGPVQ